MKLGLTPARACSVALALLLFGVHAGAADWPAPPANGEMGFILTEFAPPIYQGKDDCPNGLANTVRQNYVESLPAEERARLSRKENEVELTSRWKASTLGPNNTNICANAELFDRPMQKMVQGKIAYGLSLETDESSKADSCPHEKFTSPTGEQGIDNQAYRAMGCTGNYRGVDGTAGDIVKGWNMYLATGEQSSVLLLRGVTSLDKADNVEVIFATTDDRPILDSSRKFITNASFTVSHNPRWRNVLRGHILNGVLTTEPADIHLTQRVGHGGIRGQRAEWDLHRMRLRLRFLPDGSVKGLLGAYQPYRDVIQSSLLGGIGAATVAGIDCAAEYVTLKKLADGLKDPKTGQCTAVSMALDVAAVPAFVFDRPPTSSSTALEETK